MSRGEEFWNLFCLGEWGENDSDRRKMCLGKFKGWRKLCKLTKKWASSKTISEESVDTSCALLTSCFFGTIYWISLQKWNISEYVCKIVLKNQPLTQANPWKNMTASNISKNSALIFLPYFKNKYFQEHLTMVTSSVHKHQLNLLLIKSKIY